jgi:hypothetical protein
LLTEESTYGTPVKILVDAFPDEEFEGYIERIYPEPMKLQNIVTYLVDIKVTSPNSDLLKLTMGMQADVEFTAQSVSRMRSWSRTTRFAAGPGDLGVYVPEKDATGETSAEVRAVPLRARQRSLRRAGRRRRDRRGYRGLRGSCPCASSVDDEDEE